MSPYNPNEPGTNYGQTIEDCCEAGRAQNDESLLAACDLLNLEIIEEMVCEKEVYEPTSETCDLVTAVR